jgi:hypothetical protein
VIQEKEIESSNYVSPRDVNGFLKTVTLPLKENGLINWRKIISKEHLALNRYNLAGRGVSIESMSQDEISKLIDESPEEDLVIKLGGFRELAAIRGFEEIDSKIEGFNQDGVSIKVTIKWIANQENPRGLTVSAIASASPANTDQLFSKFLETIAENRAFIRAVRNSLGIISLGQDEFKQEDVKIEAQNVKIQSLLGQAMEKAGVSLEGLKIASSDKGFIWNDKWTSVEKIDPAAAMSFIPLLKTIIQQ